MFIQSIVCLVVICATSAQVQVSVEDSPCPYVFNYENNGNGKGWFGALSVEKFLSKNIQSLNLEIVMATPARANNDSKIELETHLDEISHNIENEHPIRYTVTLPSQEPLATVTSIAINGIIICVGPPPKPFPGSYLTTITVRHQLNVPTKLTPYKPTNKSCKDVYESLYCFIYTRANNQERRNN